MTRTDNQAEVGMHVFEKAGLGKAPFHLVGVVVREGPIMVGNCMIGAPGQPMGTCKFCGTGIKDCYVVRSFDGRNFEVGCDCVMRTGDKGLIKAYRNSPEVRALNKAKRDSLNDRKQVELKKLIEDNAEKLSSMPVKKWNGEIESQYDYLTRVIPMCGAAGRARYLKHVKSLLAA